VANRRLALVLLEAVRSCLFSSIRFVAAYIFSFFSYG
jgi:hypothetical protein